MSDFDPNREQFAARLARLPISSETLDPLRTFYNAGYAAAMAEAQWKLQRFRRFAVAGSAAALMLVSVIAFRVGSSSQLSSQRANSVQRSLASPARSGAPESAALDSNLARSSTGSGSVQSAVTTGQPSKASSQSEVAGIDQIRRGSEPFTTRDLALSSSWWIGSATVPVRGVGLKQQELLRTWEVSSTGTKGTGRGSLYESRGLNSPNVRPRAPKHNLQPLDWKKMLPDISQSTEEVRS